MNASLTVLRGGAAVKVGGSATIYLARGQREFGVFMIEWNICAVWIVPASCLAGIRTLTESVVDDALDVADAAAAFDVAAETTVDMLGVTERVIGTGNSGPDLVVADDVAGTDNHENRQALR